MVSEYVLDSTTYHNESVNVTWETCSLRKWLNTEFYNTAFDDEEKRKIVETIKKNEVNPSYRINGGNDTKDRVFLLSIAEANRYFKDSKLREVQPTAYAVSRGAYKDNGNRNSWWWLRTLGNKQNNASYVYYDGNVNPFGLGVNFPQGGVRPALWVSIQKSKA